MHVESGLVVHGMVAEFLSGDELLAAAEKSRLAGYRYMDAYSPFPVHGLSDAIGFKDQKVPWIVFLAGLTGATCGLALQYYVSVWDYPMNVGGKPLFSLPSFVPVTFEATILFAAFGALLGMLGLNKLPTPYHPIFETPNFRRASMDRFFLCIEAKDPLFDEQKTREFMQGLAAENVSLVEAEEAA